MLNIALVAGSGRNNSQSGKVARFLRQRLIQLGLTSDAAQQCHRPGPRAPAALARRR